MYNLIENSVNYSHPEVCGKTVKIYHLQVIMVILVNLMGLMLLIHLILKQK